MASQIEKYLSNYAEPEIKIAQSLASYQWKHAVALPLYNESEWIPQLFESLLAAAHHSPNVLAIGILNGDAKDAHKSLEYFAQFEQGELGTSPPALMCRLDSNLDCLLINRTGEDAFPPKQGVGLARKIGCDLATQLYHQGSLTSSFVQTTDGDVWVPNNYFSVQPSPNSAALLYPFTHTSKDPHLAQSHSLYESYLHYYVEGLHRAGSPYAFQTVGSTIAISIPHYAIVRGFPKKEAGEDFYLLNKLAKVGEIQSLKAPTIEIHARKSLRVPFGTGQATAKIDQSLSENDPYRVYPPSVFEELGTWISSAIRYLEGDADALECLSESARKATESLEATPALENIIRTRTVVGDRVRQFHVWFDAFRTLKFIHFLTENGHSRIPCNEVFENS